MKTKHPMAEVYAEEIERVRRGDVSAAQKMMRDCAKALCEQDADGRNNLAGQFAVYIAQVLVRLARSRDTARLFCLGRPAHRPKRVDDSGKHLDRARKVLTHFQRGGTITAAIRAVAAMEHVTPGAIRASWRAKGQQAMIDRLMRTPKSDRGHVRFPPKRRIRGGT